MLVFAAALTALLALTGIDAGSVPPACNSLQPVRHDYQKLILSSPLHIFRSTLDIYKCAKVAFVGPSADNRTYTGSAIILRGDYTFAYNLHFIDNSLFRTTLCRDGSNMDFQTVYLNAQQPHYAFCAVVCNPQDGTKYDAVVCSGKSNLDLAGIEQYVSTTLKGLSGIKDLRDDCDRPRHCDFYVN